MNEGLLRRIGRHVSVALLGVCAAELASAQPAPPQQVIVDQKLRARIIANVIAPPCLPLETKPEFKGLFDHLGFNPPGTTGNSRILLGTLALTTLSAGGPAGVEVADVFVYPDSRPNCGSFADTYELTSTGVSIASGRRFEKRAVRVNLNGKEGRLRLKFDTGPEVALSLVSEGQGSFHGATTSGQTTISATLTLQKATFYIESGIQLVK